MTRRGVRSLNRRPALTWSAGLRQVKAHTYVVGGQLKTDVGGPLAPTGSVLSSLALRTGRTQADAARALRQMSNGCDQLQRWTS